MIHCPELAPLFEVEIDHKVSEIHRLMEARPEFGRLMRQQCRDERLRLLSGNGHGTAFSTPVIGRTPLGATSVQGGQPHE